MNLQIGKKGNAMEWTPDNDNSNIEDRRGSGGRMGRAGIGGGLGIGGILLVVAFGLLTGQNPLQILGLISSAEVNSPAPNAPDVQGPPANDKTTQFVRFVFNDVQKTWHSILPQYRDAKLVLFTDVTDSGCGDAQSATGPFYCPPDQKVYIDLGFYQELADRFSAPGDFAQAYVLAHEVGHHVQNILGIEQKVRRLQQSNPSQQNALSVSTELQADCFAGVWGKSAAQRGELDPGDMEAGLNAAKAIGDDRLQKQAGRRVSPDNFTHGSSDQRYKWFKRGLDTGKIDACDTFAGN
ncbi:MAG: neutral zinc metallopeptidase [Acidobacteriota bacterium]